MRVTSSLIPLVFVLLDVGFEGSIVYFYDMHKIRIEVVVRIISYIDYWIMVDLQITPKRIKCKGLIINDFYSIDKIKVKLRLLTVKGTIIYVKFNMLNISIYTDHFILNYKSMKFFLILKST